ncbi:MAG: ABC transporter permease [Firmicutes bacterium]|nr:ABC transporter permease [Bacillota bacterium]
MFNREIVQVAIDALRANKTKAFLTALGVVIGSACIVLVVTIALSGKQYIMAQIEGIGSNIVYAKHILEDPEQLLTAASDEITLDDMEAVRRQIPQVVAVAGTRNLPTTVVTPGGVRPVDLVGVTEEFQRIRNLVVLRGRFLDAQDFVAHAKVCVITEELARRAFPYEDPVGQDLRVGELRFTVVGVFRERISTFGQSEIKEESVVVPLPVFNYYTEEDFIRVLYAQAARPEDVPWVTQRVEEILRSRHRPGATYRAQNLTALLETAGKISLTLTIVLLLIAFIALVISGIGIMNIMLVTVTQRTREIGIRKAIGARRREILAQFLLEALLISGSGAVVGILLAVSLPALVRAFVPQGLPVPISGLSVAVAFLASCLTGIIFGYLPASRAAKLPPTESLRYE